MVDDVTRSVGRAIVNDHPFRRQLGLATDGIDGGLDVLFLVTYGGDDYVPRHFVLTLNDSRGISR